jgi:CRISPR system Cascade subunit CasB
MTETAQQSQADSLATHVARLAGVIASPHYPNGDRAALRRWVPGQPLPLAFYRLWLRHLDAELPDPDRWEKLQGLMALTWAIATLGAEAHAPKRPFGQALAESRFAEGRLERLLSAPDDVRLELFMSAIRFLAAKGERVDLTEAACFVLTHDADKREVLHRRIAADYYRHTKDSQT